MEQCLIDNRVCSIQGQKCQNCKLDDCRHTIEMLEKVEDKETKWKRKLIEVQLPEQCKNCPFLEIIDLNNQIVRCSYLVKNKCLIK